jgi:hypothetical protein
MESPDPDPDRRDDRRGSRISLQTLIVASVASAAASFAAARLWGAGTLISAAATPVVVALVSEFLRRPVEKVAATAKKVPTGHSVPVVRRPMIPGHEDPTRFEHPAEVTANVDPETTEPAGGEAWRPRWRLAIATGLLAFAIVVAFYTVPDLIAGSSITGNGDGLTFVGGPASPKKQASPTTTSTTSTPTTTPTTTTPSSATSTTTPSTGETSTSSTTASTSTSSTTTPATSTTPAAVSSTTTTP